MNAFNKLPYDISVKIDKEASLRMEEFIKFNTELYEKLTFEEQDQIEDWIITMTTYEFYRLYGIQKKDMPENDEIPEFRDLVQIDDK